MPDDPDLVSIIKLHLQELRRPFTPIWIKGHQDSLQSYESLPFHARLNIDADFLATRYRQRGRLRSSSSSDHQRGQRVSILINGVTITSQFDANIRFHVNGYHLRRYMQDKQSWSDSIWNDIDFHLFGQHTKRLRPHHQVTHMKRVHGQLPLGVRRYQQSTIKDPVLKLCPCCKSHEETADHLLRCTQNPSFDSSLRQLRKDLVTADTHPLRYLMADGIEHWSKSQPFQPTTMQFPCHLHSTIQAALAAQHQIGWEAALSGFLSQQWGSLAMHDMHTSGKLDRTKGAARMRTCITAIHDHSQRLWLARNSALHATDDDTVRDIRSSENAEIKDLYKQPHLLRAGDRHYCERSLDRLLNGPPSTRRRWLRRVKKSIAEHLRDGGHQTLITGYLHTIQETV